MDFLIQTVKGKVRHDFSFTLLESIEYQKWIGKNYKGTVVFTDGPKMPNYIPVGSQICMNTPTGAKMAKCEMMQNNPSWQIEENEFPLAFNMSPTLEPLIELAYRLR